MEEIIINGKALYTPKGAAREYAAVGCNFYTGCPHNCSYCYLKRGVLSHSMGGTDVKLKSCFKGDIKNAMNIFIHECNKYMDYLRKTGIFFSFSTDPCIDETMQLTWMALEFCNSNYIPAILLTKNAKFPFYDGFNQHFLIDKNMKRGLFHFGFTLTGCDDMEPGATTNSERIHAMRYLKGLGFKTWASIEPIIDFISSLSVIEKSIIWCDHYKIGLRSGVSKDYYDLDELTEFVCAVNDEVEVAKRDYARYPTVYWKESIKKVCKIPHVYPGYWDYVVGKDYIW